MARGTDLLGRKEKMLGPGAKIVWDDRKLEVAIQQAMGPKLKKAAQVVAGLAKQEVPVGKIRRAASQFASWKGRKPGSLKASIKVKKSKYKGGGYIVTVGGRDTYYWFFVEYGTHKMYPQWFMRRALTKSKSRLRARF